MRQLPRNSILVGDIRRLVSTLPAHSVDCIITSPPYFRLRDYGDDRQIGLEPSVEQWVDELRTVWRGLARVLKPSGSAWLNLGDSYSRHQSAGAPPKSLLLGPERLVLALAQDGWTVRNKVIWAKTNSMPTSVCDRLTTTWEVLYFLVRSPRYYFDLDAIRIPHRSRPTNRVSHTVRIPSGPPVWAGPLAGSNSGLARLKAAGQVGHPLGRNPGDVWSMAVGNYRGQHFAAFPPALIERPLLASCPERTCNRCGAPWARPATRSHDGQVQAGALTPTCRCQAGYEAGVVFDPFAGVGTVGLVAHEHGRDWVGIELSARFAAMARRRLAEAQAQHEGDDRAVA